MSDRAPAPWLVEHLGLIRRGGLVLDVACGRGRHALALAARGYRVEAVDRDAAAIRTLDEAARASGLDVLTRQVDLETEPPPDLGDAVYDAIVVFCYLHRPLFPALVRALAPGGLLVYETFTAGQAARGHPRNPAFLLQPGELPKLAAPLVVRHAREGEVEGRLVASLVAERPALVAEPPAPVAERPAPISSPRR